METEISNGKEGRESVLSGAIEPYQSNAVEVSSLYPFDAQELAIELPHGGHVVTVHYRKPETSEYLARQKALHVKSRIVDGVMTGTPLNHDADTELFDALVLRANKRKADAITPLREYEAEECRRFPYEFKVRVIKRITVWPFEVFGAEGDDLLDEHSTLTVKQTVGQMTLAYTMRPLSAKDRQKYENAVQSQSRVKNGDLLLETESHVIEKAMRLFGGDSLGNGGYFISVEGGRLESGPYTLERQLEFVRQIDAMFQVGVIDAICRFYGGDQD